MRWLWSRVVFQWECKTKTLFICKVWLAVVFMKVITFVHWLFWFTQVIRQSQKLVIIFFVKRSSCPVPWARQLSLVTAPVIRKFVILLYVVLHSTADKWFFFSKLPASFPWRVLWKGIANGYSHNISPSRADHLLSRAIGHDWTLSLRTDCSPVRSNGTAAVSGKRVGLHPGCILLFSGNTISRPLCVFKVV